MHELLPPDLGDGWMSKPATTMAQIAVAFGGFDAREVRRRLATYRPGIRLNVNHVGEVLDHIKSEWEEQNDAT